MIFWMPKHLKKKIKIFVMSLSVETIKNILGISGGVDLIPSEMARNLKITFFPHKENIDEEILEFGEKLKTAFKNLGVQIIPYNEAIEWPFFKSVFKRCLLFFKLYSLVAKSLKSEEEALRFKKSHSQKFFKFVFGKKIKRKIAIVSLGENKESDLPIDHTTSFKENPIITILKNNVTVNKSSIFKEHMDAALNLFAWNMTNLAVCIDDKNWMIYSFNLSHPIFPIDKNFEENVLNSLIPKIAAPVIPPSLSEFTLLKNNFDPGDNKYKPYVNDLIENGPFFEKTGLYPRGREIDSLKFRNYFYRWIGAVHLDERNGMSFGFLARQLPVEIFKPLLLEEIDDKNLFNELKNKEYVNYGSDSYVKIGIKDKNLVVKIPEVWVLTSRSGADKTNLNPQKDLIKIGLKNGKMFLGLENRVELSGDYKPSFDTKVILSHAVSNAIFASLMSYFEPDSFFPITIQKDGFAIAHWHGYVNPKFIPEGWLAYGQSNPSVSCSSPQSAVYAFQGKESGIINKILHNDFNYMGDINIEPHHGTNMTFATLKDMVNFLLSNKEISKLGNEYLDLYYDSTKLF